MKSEGKWDHSQVMEVRLRKFSILKKGPHQAALRVLFVRSNLLGSQGVSPRLNNSILVHNKRAI
jgi:hypothetical protein